MKIVCFDNTGSCPAFEYENGSTTEFIDFNPPTDDLDPNINVDDYVVELLINPIFSNQSDVFSLCIKVENDPTRDRQTVGAVFPVSALDSDQALRKGQIGFLYVGFYHLLERLPRMKSGKNFSDNFETNVCACVFHKRLINNDNPLHLCIHSLRKFGYSYFTPNDKVADIKEYSRTRLLDSGVSCINISMGEPLLYNHPIIDRILRDLKYATNITHRFVLLYQVIEFLMEDAIAQDVDLIYDQLTKRSITVNDYFDEVSKVGREKFRIKNIFKDCTIKDNECSKFVKACKSLFDASGFTSDFKQSAPECFYAFRNKMTHSYRRLYDHSIELSATVQYFEQVVLLIIERYPRSIS